MQDWKLLVSQVVEDEFLLYIGTFFDFKVLQLLLEWDFDKFDEMIQAFNELLTENLFGCSRFSPEADLHTFNYTDGRI